MWRTPPDLRFTCAHVTRPKTSRDGAPRPTKRTRGSERRRARVVAGLRRVARRSRLRSRARRSELLLCGRVEAVRWELLEMAALLQAASDPPPDVVAVLHELLTDGCSSPLLNEDVPAEELSAVIKRARAAVLGCGHAEERSLPASLPTDPSSGRW